MRKGLVQFSPKQKNIKGVLLGHKLYNPACESDDFISVVLIQREDDFVVWNYNAQTGGYCNGGYHGKLIHAWQDFNNRGFVHNGGAFNE